MKRRTIFLLPGFILFLATLSAIVHLDAATEGGGTNAAAKVSAKVIAFYYPWYGNPATDGRYANWNHPVAVRNEPPRAFPGGDDIGANFYPSLGCYSVNDPEVLRLHMRQLRQARVGVISVSWWGQGTFTDRALPGVFKAAEEAGILINFHIEPFPGRNAATTRAAISYLVGRYGSSPACHRLSTDGNRPVFFVYDSYLTPAADWASILQPRSTNTIRGTDSDAVVLGLWVKEHEEEFMLKGGFDGFYTYFATEGFTYGSSIKNWPKLQEWARQNGRLFVPCVAPGYNDTRIRPWNGVNTRDRENGAYYDRMWSAALEVSPELVAITSFNEWHEGTQIEPAAPKRIDGFTYLDYLPLPADWYLERTAHFAIKVPQRPVGWVRPPRAFVYFLGPFRKYGRHPWTNGMTLKDGIEVAGGFLNRATDDIIVTHRDGSRDYYRLGPGKSLTNNSALQPGDYIVVKEFETLF